MTGHCLPPTRSGVVQGTRRHATAACTLNGGRPSRGVSSQQRRVGHVHRAVPESSLLLVSLRIWRRLSCVHGGAPPPPLLRAHSVSCVHSVCQGNKQGHL